MKKITLLIVLLATLALGACSSKKNVTARTEPMPVVPPLAAACSANAAWDVFEAPMSMELSSPSHVKLSGRLTMAYGRCLRFSVRVIGMEMGQLYADRDSVYLVIKPLRVACAMPVSSLTDATGMGLAELQCALAGQSFAPGEGRLTPQTAVRWAESNDNGLAAIRSRGTCDLTFTYAPDAAGIMELANAKACRNSVCVNIEYSGNTATSAGVMPAEAQGACDAGRTRVRASWRLNWGNARFDGVRVPEAPAIPSSYDRLTPAELIARLGSMI